MLPIACVLAALLGASQSPPSDLRRVDLDALIEMLPPTGCEGPAETELRRRLGEGQRMSDVQWERALLRSQVLRFRSKWPADVPLAMSIQAPTWTLGLGGDAGGTSVRAIPGEKGLKGVQGGESTHSGLGCGLFDDPRRRTEVDQELGLLKPGRHPISFDVSVVTMDGSGQFLLSSATWNGPVSIEFEIVPSLEQAMPAVDSEEVRDIVRRSLCRFPPPEDALGPPLSVIVGFTAEGRDAPKLAVTAVSLEIDLFKKGALLASGWTRVDQAGGFRPCQSPKSRWTADGVVLGPLGPPSSQVEDPLADLEVRVRGVSKDVLHHWGAEAWWNGSFTVPLADLPTSDWR